MKLFEGGILDKITNDEYEKMFQRLPVDVESVEKEPSEQEEKVDTKLGERQSMNTKAKISSEKELTALNLRMLQGAFYLVLIGHILATATLILEIECRRAPRRYMRNLRVTMRATYRLTYRRVARWLRQFWWSNFLRVLVCDTQKLQFRNPTGNFFPDLLFNKTL